MLSAKEPRMRRRVQNAEKAFHGILEEIERSGGDDAVFLTQEMMFRAEESLSPNEPSQREHHHPCPFKEPEKDCPWDGYSIHLRHPTLSDWSK